MHHPNKIVRSALSALLALSMGVSLVRAPQPALADDGLTQPGGLTPDGAPEWAVDDGRRLDADKPAPAAALQSHFDLRDLGLVTPVKSQNPWSSCWAFGGISAAEISILTALGTTYKDYPLDLSERHLIYFALRPVTKPDSPSQAGEGLHTFDDSPNAAFAAGGFPALVTTLFGQGVGPVEEMLFPYHGANGLTSLEYFDSLGDEELEAFVKAELGPTVQLMGMTYEEFLAYVASQNGMTEQEVFESFKARIRATYESSNSYAKADDWSIPDDNEDGRSNRLLSQGMTLKDGNILPEYWNADRTAVNQESEQAIKKELASGLGVSIMFAADQTGTYTVSNVDEAGRSIGNSYNQCCDDATRPPNHGVCLVGWDDGYPAESFSPDHRPPANGAWIVKNSWGSTTDAAPDDLGNVMGKRAYGIRNAEGEYTGYFYLSYYDKTIMQPETMEYSSTLNDSGAFYVLSYDYLPDQNGFYVIPATQDVLSTANVFATMDAIKVNDVSVRVPSAGTTTTIAIYQLNEGSQDPADGELLYRGTHEFEYAGIHRVKLPEPVKVKAGSFISVITTSSTVDDGGTRLYGASACRGASKEKIEEYIVQTGAELTSYAVAVVNPGESYLYRDGEWRDWSEYLATATDTEGMVVDNFSIKVFAEPDSGEGRDGWELAADGCWTYRLGGELVRSAWTSVDGEWYYFDADARMVSGWVKDAGSWYYLNERHDGAFGAMQTGWVRSDGRWYYLYPASGGPQGAMVTGWQLVDGKWYYLYPQAGAPQGSLAVDTSIDGWRVGPDGAWVA